MKQEAYKEILLKIEKVGLDHIDEEKLTGLLMDFTDKKCTMFQDRRKARTLGASAPPMFGRTVNPISTRGADYAHHSTTSPLKFSDLATALFDHKATDSEIDAVVKHFTIKDDFQVFK